MTHSDSNRRLGLVVRSGPWCGRSNRDQLDVALMAAAMEWELIVYFQGDGLLQLLQERNGGVAGLPPGHKGWASVYDMTSARFVADKKALDSLSARGSHWVCEVESLSSAGKAAMDEKVNHWWVL